MKKYAKHMSMEDRKIIERMYRDGVPVIEIAKSLDRHYSGIYNELNRGATGKLDKNGNPEYSAKAGEIAAAKIRNNRGRPRKAMIGIH